MDNVGSVSLSMFLKGSVAITRTITRVFMVVSSGEHNTRPWSPS